MYKNYVCKIKTNKQIKNSLFQRWVHKKSLDVEIAAHFYTCWATGNTHWFMLGNN